MSLLYIDGRKYFRKIWVSLDWRLLVCRVVKQKYNMQGTKEQKIYSSLSGCCCSCSHCSNKTAIEAGMSCGKKRKAKICSLVEQGGQGSVFGLPLRATYKLAMSSVFSLYAWFIRTHCTFSPYLDVLCPLLCSITSFWHLLQFNILFNLSVGFSWFYFCLTFPCTPCCHKVLWDICSSFVHLGTINTSHTYGLSSPVCSFCFFFSHMWTFPFIFYIYQFSHFFCTSLQ